MSENIGVVEELCLVRILVLSPTLLVLDVFHLYIIFAILDNLEHGMNTNLLLL